MADEIKKPKPRKPAAKKMNSKVAVQVTAEQLDSYHEAAEKSDKAYSEWVRETLNNRAKEILERD